MRKTILITGSSQRIGKTIAIYFYKLGWNVAIHYNNSIDKIELLKSKFAKYPERIEFFQANLTIETEYKSLIEQVIKRFGKIDCLVNNAAVFLDDNFETCTRETWDLHMQINLRAPFVLSQAFYQACKKGNIINIVDQCVSKTRKSYLSYSLSKIALWSLTKTLALSMAPYIRVNAIGPGVVLPSIYQTRDDFYKSCNTTPLKKLISPIEIAKTIFFLIEKQPSLTGQLIMLDGGEHLARININQKLTGGKNMPTIEFIGYSNEERMNLQQQITQLLQELDFAYTVVYLYCKADTEVIALDGSARPMLRIYTRYKERAEIILDILKGIANIEVVYLANFQIKQEDIIYSLA